MSRRWAITGGSGYVGSLLCAKLLEQGDSVGILTRGGRRSMGEDVVVGDLSNRVVLERLVAGADFVVHLAAHVHRATRTGSGKASCIETNVVGTANLVEAVKRAAPDSFVVGVSTANVYGRSTEYLSEEHPALPETVYGATKLEGERLLLGSGLEVCVLRPAMVLGPHCPGNFARLVKLTTHGIFVQIGNTSPLKSVLPVDDLLEAITTVCERRLVCSGEIFNVGASGELLSIREIADEIAWALGVRLRVIRLPEGPVRWTAQAVDSILPHVRLATPSFGQMLDAFTSSAILDDSKLKRLTGFTGGAGVRGAIAASARAYNEKVASHPHSS